MDSGLLIFVTNICVIAFYTIMFFLGYKKGFLLQLLDLIGLLIAIYIAWLFAPVLATYFEICPQSLMPLQDTIFGSAISVYINQGLWFLIILIVVKLVLLIVRPLVKAIQRIPVLKQLNGLLGAIFSFVSSTVWIIVISFFLTLPVVSMGQDVVQQSLIKVILDGSSNVVQDIEEPIHKNDLINKLTNNMNDLSDNDREDLKEWFEENNLDKLGG